MHIVMERFGVILITLWNVYSIMWNSLLAIMNLALVFFPPQLFSYLTTDNLSPIVPHILDSHSSYIILSILNFIKAAV